VRVYVGLYGGVVVGYYYLVATSMSPDTISAEALEKFGRVNITPCVYLGMIGVHRGFQGNGVGNLLMVHAMQKTLEVANLVGIYALTLDAVDEKTAATYEMGIPKIYRA
jgi:GNAT superfamily N-acetyltransferase